VEDLFEQSFTAHME